MQLDTKNFGIIEIDEKGIINFPEGIPSFESIKKYALLGSGTEESPFKWLQSIDDPNLAFAIVDPFEIKPDYDIDLNKEVLKALQIEKPEDVLVYSIVVVPEDVSKMSMNLKAPIVINLESNLGAQVVLDIDKYSVRHYIIEELRRREVAENVGSDKKKGTINSNKW